MHLCQNRESVLAGIQGSYGCRRSEAKVIILKLLYLGGLPVDHNALNKDVLREMQALKCGDIDSFDAGVGGACFALKSGAPVFNRQRLHPHTVELWHSSQHQPNRWLSALRATKASPERNAKLAGLVGASSV